jgi:hypothetical protein
MHSFIGSHAGLDGRPARQHPPPPPAARPRRLPLRVQGVARRRRRPRAVAPARPPALGARSIPQLRRPSAPALLCPPLDAAGDQL